MRILDRTNIVTSNATIEVLHALHEIDAIRLGPDGWIAVTYPFSAGLTRHRVRLDDRIDAYAMCAIDARGMPPMLGIDRQIQATDLTNEEPITISTIGGHTSWTPSGAVVGDRVRHGLRTVSGVGAATTSTPSPTLGLPRTLRCQARY